MFKKILTFLLDYAIMVLLKDKKQKQKETVMSEQKELAIHPTIHSYIRKHKKPIGLILATVHDGNICMGWSKTNIEAGDTFDRQKGIQFALERALDQELKPPAQILKSKHWRRMKIRAERYFKRSFKKAESKEIDF